MTQKGKNKKPATANDADKAKQTAARVAAMQAARNREYDPELLSNISTELSGIVKELPAVEKSSRTAKNTAAKFVIDNITVFRDLLAKGYSKKYAHDLITAKGVTISYGGFLRIMKNDARAQAEKLKAEQEANRSALEGDLGAGEPAPGDNENEQAGVVITEE